MPGASTRRHWASRQVQGGSIHPPTLEFSPGINVLREDSRKAPDRPECFGIIACSGSTALFEHCSGARQSQAWARNQKSPSEWVTAGVTSDGLRCPLPSHRWPAPRRRVAGLIQDKQELPRQGRIRPKSGVRAKKRPTGAVREWAIKSPEARANPEPITRSAKTRCSNQETASSGPALG